MVQTLGPSVSIAKGPGLISGQGRKISYKPKVQPKKKKKACVSRHRMTLENKMLIEILISGTWDILVLPFYTLNYLNFYIEHIVNNSSVSGSGGLI